MIYDTHAHPHFGVYAGDRDAVLSRCLQQGIGVIAVGTTLADSQSAVELAHRYSHVWAAVGLHPGSVFDELFEANGFRKLLGPPGPSAGRRVVAIGETGLDYFHMEEVNVTFEELRQRQLEVFKEHLKLARRRDLPLIIHARNPSTPAGATPPPPGDAYADVLAVLRRHRFTRAVIHCFGGTPADAQRLVAQGLHLGFTANITYPKNDELRAAVAAAPLDRILVETDAPFLAPQSRRGERNDPTAVTEVVAKIAEIKELTAEEVGAATAENARRFFNLR